MKRCLLLLGLLSLSLFDIQAQTTKEAFFADINKTGGTLYAYPVRETAKTPAPAGYKPFYISHYGRHGSRYLTNEDDYKWILDVFKKAQQENSLTPLGKDVCGRLEKLWKMAKGRAGDLTSLGVNQQRGLAERMYKSFPEAFGPGSSIHARSTIVVRCILSMDAFCERLKELNPALTTDRDASERDMNYLNYRTKHSVTFCEKGPWKKDFQAFRAAHIHPQRLISSLFSDTTCLNKKNEATNVMFSLFSLAGDMQNLETSLSFYDLFEKQELFDLFQCSNYQFYVCYGNSSLNKGMAAANEAHLLTDMLDGAGKAISENRTGADLRFGHDDVLAPLAVLLHLGTCDTTVNDLSTCYKAWSTCNVVPMAANIQLIFYRKDGSDDILIKFLHNEKEVTIPVKSDLIPYYHWKDVEAYYRQRCR